MEDICLHYWKWPYATMKINVVLIIRIPSFDITAAKCISIKHCIYVDKYFKRNEESYLMAVPFTIFTSTSKPNILLKENEILYKLYREHSHCYTSRIL